MTRVLRGIVVPALASAVTAGMVVPAVPVRADPLLGQNFAVGSFARDTAGSHGPNGLAIAPPATTTVADNVNINGLLSTGTTTDTAGTASAYSKVTNVSMSTSWTVGTSTYTLSLSASQVASYCTSNPLASTANIINGKLTETAQVGTVVTSSQVINLPQLPASRQIYTYNGAVILLNAQAQIKSHTITLDGGIGVRTPAERVIIGFTGCAIPSSTTNDIATLLNQLVQPT